MTKVYVAHTLHKLPEVIAYVEKWQKELKENNSTEEYSFYIPGRDTNETAKSDAILKQNLDAIKDCDEVWVMWDGKSYGTIFDLGSAYALDKPIWVVTADKNWCNYITACFEKGVPVGKETKI